MVSAIADAQVALVRAGSTGVFDNLPMPRQHLVNHALQRRVNHGSAKRRRNARLTPKLKRNRTPFRHDPRATGRISPALGEFEASNAKWRMPRRVEPRVAARPVRPAGVLSRRAMPRPTSGCGTSNCIASAWWCGALCAACAWRSTYRCRRFAGISLRLIPVRAKRGARRRHARAQGSDAGAAAVHFRRNRRRHGRMARLGERARPADAGPKTMARLREAFTRMGGVACRPHSAAPPPPQRLYKRRPSILMRRVVAALPARRRSIRANARSSRGTRQ